MLVSLPQTTEPSQCAGVSLPTLSGRRAGSKMATSAQSSFLLRDPVVVPPAGRGNPSSPSKRAR